MITREEQKEFQDEAVRLLAEAGIVITQTEAESIEIADYGLSDLKNSGLAILVYVNTDRVCAKELIMLPNQTCPQHRHPPAEGEPGKEETFRCRWGKVFLYEEGDRTEDPKCAPPKGSEQHYTVWKEIELNPGQQYTLLPNRWHWFQSGPQGAIVSEFSTKSRDELDEFTDAGVKRETVVKGG
jgi:D-lyxose ketol-isomerase